MFTKEFWKATAERAFKTFVQTLIATGIIATAASADKSQWLDAGLVVLIATVTSILTSIASVNVGAKGTPSLVSTGPGLVPAEATEDDPEVVQQPNVQDAADRQAITDYLATEGKPDGSDA